MPFNFLHPSRFIRRFPPLASPPLLTFLLFQYVNPPASTTSCTHHVSISPFLPPCARSKKHVQVPKKRCQGLKTSSPMLAPITIEFPPFGGKVHEAGAQLQKKNRGRSCQKKTGLGKDPCRSTPKKKKNRLQKTHRQVPHSFCAPRSHKKIRPGPNDTYRSKKRMPKSKQIPCILHQMGTLYEMTSPSSSRNVSPQTRRVQKHAARHRATIQLPVILYKMLFHSRCYYLRNLRPTWYSLCL